MLRGLLFQACSLTSLKSQIWDPWLKVHPRGLVLRIFMSWKNPLTSAGFEPANLGSRGKHGTPRPPKPTIDLTVVLKAIMYIAGINGACFYYYLYYLHSKYIIQNLILNSMPIKILLLILSNSFYVTVYSDVNHEVNWKIKITESSEEFYKKKLCYVIFQFFFK